MSSMSGSGSIVEGGVSVASRIPGLVWECADLENIGAIQGEGVLRESLRRRPSPTADTVELGGMGLESKS